MTGFLRTSVGVSFSSMRVLGSFALVYLLAGGGRYQMRGHPVRRCQAGDLLVIFPDIAHAYGPDPGGRWSEIYVVFDGPVFDLWRQLGVLSPDRAILRLMPVKQHVKRLREIVKAGRENDPARQLEQVCILQRFLSIALARNSRRQVGGGHVPWPSWVSNAVEAMESERPNTITSIARSAGLSYESFRKKFRAVTGISPARYRNRLAMDRARKLIYEERLSNKQLADRLGFCDEFHFSRRFREWTGQSPSEFRRSLPKRG